MAGYRCLKAYDIDPTAVATYNHNLAPWRATVADLASDFLDSLAMRPDVVIAGPPCQGFSTIGRRDPDDLRNHLLLAPVDLAIRLKARTLFLENVRGAICGVQSRYWTEATRRLERNGYSTATLDVAAAGAGLPQIRRRVVLVAARRSFHPPPPVSLGNARPLRSILDLPRGLANHHPKRLDPTSRTGQIAVRIGRGQKLSNVRSGARHVHTWEIPEVFGPVSARERELLECLIVLRRRCRVRSFGDADPVSYERLRANFGSSTPTLVDSLLRKGYIRNRGADLFDLRRTFNGKFHRLDPDRPAHSVLTQFCDPTHFLHPFYDRGFTTREAARLQGFPDSFQFHGSTQQQATQIGNAMPPSVALELARWMKSELL